MNTNKTKTTRGRQKIEIKKIKNVANRQVTFTKRRGGLFKKAAELCVLTGADVAIIVKSPGGRTFAFGHPCVGVGIERYLGGGGGGESPAMEDLTRGFGGRYDDVAKEMAAEKRRGDMIVGSDVPNNGFWWEEPIDGVGAEEQDAYVAALEELKKKVTMRADEMMKASNNSMQSSNSMLGINIMNPISSENNSSHELAYHFINQSLDSTFSNSLFPFG